MLRLGSKKQVVLDSMQQLKELCQEVQTAVPAFTEEAWARFKITITSEMPRSFHTAVKRAGEVRTELRHMAISAVFAGIPAAIFLEGVVYLFPAFPCNLAVTIGAGALCKVKLCSAKESTVLIVVITTGLIALVFHLSEINSLVLRCANTFLMGVLATGAGYSLLAARLDNILGQLEVDVAVKALERLAASERIAKRLVEKVCDAEDKN